jgi:molybdopterin molybdotransferase
LTGDDEAATAKVVDQALDSSDLLVTVGGVSVGDYDVVRPALQAAGATLEFWKVRIKPGKPLVFGRRGKSLVLGLPGNPVSAQVTFGLFGMPLLRALQGDSERGVRFRRLRLVAPVRQQPGRRGFYRAKLDGDAVVALENQASGAATSMAWADALVMVPPDSQGYEAGEMVSVILLRDL